MAVSLAAHTIVVMELASISQAIRLPLMRSVTGMHCSVRFSSTTANVRVEIQQLDFLCIIVCHNLQRGSDLLHDAAIK